ncbi:RING/U-box superfamily protein isoform 1 [Tripterygium wilfordii]|uniref:RING/U-box superfamily protein isoform 1 n=1 Tax=Tripterygium wilfordii TaxID=458696 RepID=A0A7J7D8I4_TRIWF|nr:RING-H2 finger protein ATL8-like [Tripterygium wilfordii]KAF5742598.1 RING/U-box superfamily protein isoform 1 [Tripterygium wilfordii]
MISSGLNLVMTVIGFAVSTMFIVFVCTRLVCARIQLNATRRSFPIAVRSDLSILERGLNGLEPVVYANFPTKKYSDSFFSSTEDTQCTVCLAEYQSEDLLRILPYCGHFFHVNCIDIWLQQHSTCPVCRISLREFSDRKRGMQPMYSSTVRSQLASESYDTRSHHRLLNRREFPSSTHDNHGMDSNQEDHFVSGGDGAEAGEIVSPITEGDQITKDSRTKHAESPSNS